MSTSSITTLILAAALALAAGCSDPCTSLSSTICDCKVNEPERNLCDEQVRIARATKDEITEAESLACDALLESCTCEALERGDLKACGLAP